MTQLKILKGGFTFFVPSRGYLGSPLCCHTWMNKKKNTTNDLKEALIVVTRKII